KADQAIREFPRNVGLPVDGIVGATTQHALLGLRPVGPGPGLSPVLEREAIRYEGTLRGARIAVDRRHGGDEAGAARPRGRTEAGGAGAGAAAVAAMLRSRGAAPLLLRPEDGSRSESERAAAANADGVDLLVSLHLNAQRDSLAEGATVFYCG